MSNAQKKAGEPSYEDYVERIHYSEKYSDDKWEYRHVILPKPLLKLIPRDYFDPDEPGVLRILKDAEWRKIGITQSLGWEHYEVHAPEPHILLFRREKDYQEKYLNNMNQRK
ncbi:putative CKS1-cyclin-dependent kinases regulatory subunit [Meira miltonrushii]|uniref:Cyclin-dependent kinases regulatory subunit n=1 Tax=Meira miltonrushii TaxID=1280837 RepID=A0A316V3V9_9BASI|nr:putative CKS1-cyclin-dependent kinases regulatory subunit [Meira miltonrushii]PWN32236.1 putative CKS1-cyclin-dependent kinases regulatory subunit [Meira miltonrushii]